MLHDKRQDGDPMDNKETAILHYEAALTGCQRAMERDPAGHTGALLMVALLHSWIAAVLLEVAARRSGREPQQALARFRLAINLYPIRWTADTVADIHKQLGDALLRWYRW